MPGSALPRPHRRRWGPRGLKKNFRSRFLSPTKANQNTPQPSFHPFVYKRRCKTYVPAIHKDNPSRGKLDDFRHLIDSSVCDLFVTQDKGILDRWEDLRPFKLVEAWDTFRERLES